MLHKASGGDRAGDLQGSASGWSGFLACHGVLQASLSLRSVRPSRQRVGHASGSVWPAEVTGLVVWQTSGPGRPVCRADQGSGWPVGLAVQGCWQVRDSGKPEVLAGKGVSQARGTGRPDVLGGQGAGIPGGLAGQGFRQARRSAALVVPQATASLRTARPSCQRVPQASGSLRQEGGADQLVR